MTEVIYKYLILEITRNKHDNIKQSSCAMRNINKTKKNITVFYEKYK